MYYITEVELWTDRWNLHYIDTYWNYYSLYKKWFQGEVRVHITHDLYDDYGITQRLENNSLSVTTTHRAREK